MAGYASGGYEKQGGPHPPDPKARKTLPLVARKLRQTRTIDFGHPRWQRKSSLIACESMGFDYIGFEIDPDYYAAAKNRMSKGIQAVLI
jgi:DNA modification methylase